MKKLTSIISLVLAIAMLTSCGTPITDPHSPLPTNSTEPTPSAPPTEEPTFTEPSPDITPETQEETKMHITVGNKQFTVTLEKNASTDALLEMLPLTLNMSELNGNEKYFYLDSDLPTNASRPSGIHAGDLMLYGSSCLVLFYESFSTSYSYTPLGHIEDVTGLAEALGNGSVTVTFEIN